MRPGQYFAWLGEDGAEIFSQKQLLRELDDWRPDAVGFGVNYLANIPEVIDLAKEIRRRLPECFVFAGGHSGSFTASFAA